MKFFFFFAFFFICVFASSDKNEDILSIFKVEGKKAVVKDRDDEGKVLLRKPNLFSRAIRGWLKRPTSEQSVWIAMIERGDLKEALFQWDRAFSHSSLLKTETARAFFAYLLYSNGMKVQGMETLFGTKKPKKIHPLALDLWGENFVITAPEWDLLNVRWNPAWKGLFPLGIEVHLQYISLGNKLDIGKLTRLLSQTREDHPRRSLIEWKLFLAMSLADRTKSAAKLLKQLMLDSPSHIDKDIMWISVARLLFQNAYLSPAIAYYGKVPRKSEYWMIAQEEMAASYLRKGEPQNALAILMTLVDPKWSVHLTPETYFLKALAELKICHYPRLQKTFDGFKKHFQAKTLSLQSIVQKKRQPLTLTLFEKMTRQDPLPFVQLGKDTAKLPLYVTKDRLLRKYIGIHQNALEELKLAKKLFSKMPQNQIYKKVKIEMENRLKAMDEASYRRIAFLAQEEMVRIHGALKKLHIIEAEFIQNIYKAQNRLARSQKIEVNRSVKKGSTALMDKYKLYFSQKDKEQWIDELSYYNIDVEGACTK